MKTPPPFRGNVEVAPCNDGIIIAGDQEGLKSIANLPCWLAEMDQNDCPNMPDGERAHIHLYSGSTLSKNSESLELCRLDAKGTGIFPTDYEPVDEYWPVAYPEWFREADDDE